MKTHYECKNCGNTHTEIQLPGDEYERDLELCPKCRIKNQTCRHCLNPESILTPETCCTNCSILREKRKLQEIEEYKNASEIKKKEFELALHIRKVLNLH
jgi:hypothetical protein